MLLVKIFKPNHLSIARLALNQPIRPAHLARFPKPLKQVHQLISLIRPYQSPRGLQLLATQSSSIGCKLTRLIHHDARVVPFILPDIGEGIKEVIIKEWLIKVGDSVHEFDGLCEVESDKATARISSRFEGSITRLHYKVGDMAAVGKPLVDIQLASTNSESDTCTADQSKPMSETTNEPTSNLCIAPKQPEQRTVATLPSVRRMAREHGIDLGQVSATGKHNRILKEDLIAHLQRVASGGAIKLEANAQRRANAVNKPDEEEIRLPIKGIQRAMFKQMTRSLQVPHFSYSDEIDLTKLIEFTELQKQARQPDRVSLFAYFIKMVSLALLDYPQLNATVDESGNYLIQKSRHNIGIAIDTKVGLIVPNIKDVQQMTAQAIHGETLRLRQLAYESKLDPAELSGATMSLSNIGAIGGLFGVPLLVAPEILIGALGKARAVPRFNSAGSVERRHVLQVVWSADHRVVDGATLSRFSNLLRRLLEEPEFALTRLA